MSDNTDSTCVVCGGLASEDVVCINEDCKGSGLPDGVSVDAAVRVARTLGKGCAHESCISYVSSHDVLPDRNELGKIDHR